MQIRRGKVYTKQLEMFIESGHKYINIKLPFY